MRQGLGEGTCEERIQPFPLQCSQLALEAGVGSNCTNPHLPCLLLPCRRVEDYYELGAAWGHGATCTVQECVGRYSGRRFALKSRLHKSREATQAMHNELRILQIAAKKP